MRLVCPALSNAAQKLTPLKSAAEKAVRINQQLCRVLPLLTRPVVNEAEPAIPEGPSPSSCRSFSK
jgi:hypothetical protein